MTKIIVERESESTAARFSVPTVKLRNNQQAVAGAENPFVTRTDNIQAVFDGISFYAFKVKPSADPLLSLNSIDILITTAVNKPVGVGVKAEAGGNAELYVYEGVTDVVGGTIVPALNRNRSSTNTAVTGVVIQPTSVTLGTIVYGDLILGGAGGKAAGAIVESDYAFLKADTSYLFRLTNTTNQSQVAALAVQWIENG
jgi:hypothetical protein